MNPTTPQENEPRWLHFARGELARNITEVAGPDANPRILEYFTATRLQPRDGDETAWCAAFVGFCLKSTGYVPSGSAAARSYLKWGVALTQPRAGAIVVLSRGDNPLQGHVGFWVGQTAQQVVLLAGNQRNSVSIAVFPKWRTLGYRWPIEQLVETTPVRKMHSTS